MNKQKMTFLFLAVISIYALGAGFSDVIMSNYFKDAFNVDATMRGLIEFPREIPGILSLILISYLSFLGNYKIAIISQLCIAFSLIVLAILNPSFSIMLVFLFVFSIGIHLFMPLQDAIAFSIFGDEENLGEKLGQYKSCSTLFALVAAVIVFFGFRFKIFSFTQQPIIIFLLSAVFILIAAIILFIMQKQSGDFVQKKEKFELVFKKDYKYYYALSVLYGTQKQIVFVFGPWVFIELLHQGADTIAFMGILSGLASTFFLKALGKWIDKFGIKKIMYADAFSFIGVYIVYGILTHMIINNKFANLTTALILTGILFVADRISNNISVVRTMYLNSILTDKNDLAKVLSTGIAIDHIVTVIFAPIAGFVWTTIGPEYIFFFAAFLSIFNVIIAKKADIK